jgi:hypothetical protein
VIKEVDMSKSVLISAYKGRYPMVDHIKMPLFDPTPDIHIPASYEFWYVYSDKKTNPKRSISKHYYEEAL